MSCLSESRIRISLDSKTSQSHITSQPAEPALRGLMPKNISYAQAAEACVLRFHAIASTPQLKRLYKLGVELVMLLAWLQTGIAQQITYTIPAAASAPVSASSANSRVFAEEYGKLPLSFEANCGQSDPQVKFLSRGNGYSLFLTDTGATLALTKHDTALAGHGQNMGLEKNPASPSTIGRADVVRMELTGANHNLRVAGGDKLAGIVNYFIGNDPANWHRSVPTYGKVWYSGVYPGIDLVYYGNQRRLEYDFIVGPGKNPRQIQLHFVGAQKIKLTPAGNLKIIAENGQITFQKPVLYQEKDGQRLLVEGKFNLQADNRITFAVGKYDQSRALIIDPVLAYSTYLGGAGNSQSDGGQGAAIAVDAEGNTYVAGTTAAIDFPVSAGAFQGQPNDGLITANASYSFVTKLNPSGTSIIYSTFLGGPGGVDQYQQTPPGDAINSVFVDSAGNAYLTGSAHSNGFPVTTGAYQTVKLSVNTSTSCFLTKLNPVGTELLYSTFIGGNGMFNGSQVPGDACSQVVVNSKGNAYVTGTAWSGNFPVTSGAVQTKHTDYYKAFVAEFDPAAATLVYSTYVGGSLLETGNAIAIDEQGDAYITGQTTSTDLPYTAGALQTINESESNQSKQPTGFVAKLNPTGTAFLYLTYLGGSGGLNYGDNPKSLALDSSGDAYVAGVTPSTDFPLENAFQSVNKAQDGISPVTGLSQFVSKLNPEGTALVFSTYFGSSQGEYAVPGSGGIAVDADGNAYLTGATFGLDFPVSTNAFQSSNNAILTLHGIPSAPNAFLAELTSMGKLAYSTYLGGSGYNYFVNNFGISPNYVGDSGSSIVLDGKGNAYIAGTAQSSDFPTTAGAYETTKTAQYNAFVSKFSFSSTVASGSLTTLVSGSNPATAGSNVTFAVHVESTSGSGIPTGSVTFTYPGGTATVALNANGEASYYIATLPEGDDAITATYSGDKNFSKSSNTLTEVIAGLPAKIVVLSGSEQTTTNGTPFPDRVVVKVEDASGTPVPNAYVDFSGTGLSFIPGTVITGYDGLAAVGVTATGLGNLTGTATVTISSIYAYFSLVSESQTAAPIISPSGRSTITPTSVTITDTTAGATIFYTTNGTVPTTASTKYTGAITVSSTETIEAIAVAPGYTVSAVASATYTFVPQPISIFVIPNQAWTDTGLSVTAGERLTITATGELDWNTNNTCPSDKTCTNGPDGSDPGVPCGGTTVTAPNLPCFSLIGRIGNNGTPFAVGASFSLPSAPASGELYLGVNDNYFGDNTLGWTAQVSIISTSELQFVPVIPCRIVDTRNPTGAFGGPELAANATRTFNVPQSACGIPATAAAYSLNVTVVPVASLGYLTIWPAGEPQPNVSTLNSDGRVKANATITPAGTNGGVSVYVSNPTQFILDIDGYFVPAGTSAAGLEFFPVTPCRIADTRNADGPLGGPSLASATSRAFPVQSSNCGISPLAKAYSLNVTAVPHESLGFLTIWPTGEAQPVVSTLNSSTGVVTANAAIVEAGTSGDVSVYVSDASDVILDINGYFGPPAPGGMSLYTVNPCRVLDTRNSAPFDGTLTVPVVTSSCAPPFAAKDYVFNATVLPVDSLSFLTLWAAGTAQPVVSTLNASDGAITSNMAIVPTINGSIDAFATDSTNLLLDISSYFAP